LHKGLRPFTGTGLHKRGVWLPGDDRWGACSPNDKEKRLDEKKNSKVKLSWFIKGFPQKFLKAETKIKPKLNFEI
jgi:hypothetical protein